MKGIKRDNKKVAKKTSVSNQRSSECQCIKGSLPVAKAPKTPLDMHHLTKKTLQVLGN